MYVANINRSLFPSVSSILDPSPHPLFWLNSSTRKTKMIISLTKYAFFFLLTIVVVLAHVGNHQVPSNHAVDTGADGWSVVAHILCMAIAIGFLTPLGIFFARNFHGKWVPLHAGTIGCAAFLLMSAGFTFGVLAYGKDASSFGGTHHKIGLILYLAFIPQILLGITSYAVYAQPLRPRIIVIFSPWYNVVHRWLGRAILLLAWANMFIGMWMMGAHAWGFALWGIGVAAWTIVFGVGEFWRMQRRKKRERKEASEGPTNESLGESVNAVSEEPAIEVRGKGEL
ncbi:hypothetical protein BC937DRAFT_94824 [Endogone sp. FLAS-F59071]|nr:hypothetical protein BC937DRAFT_94824 [Endogone sp. FLAS-F59071]|eukprot:RUS13762.1 hypothetical protein BC937DRAFT_94824 [Endogone sp. FLAS-F59071]